MSVFYGSVHSVRAFFIMVNDGTLSAFYTLSFWIRRYYVLHPQMSFLFENLHERT